MGEFSGFALVPEQGAIPQKGQLDPDMQRRIEAMAARIDLSDNAAVMGFGARAQKEMGAFSDIALQQMLRQDIKPLESVMQTLAEQIKACSFTAQAKGLFRRVFGGAAPLAEVQAAYDADPKSFQSADIEYILFTSAAGDDATDEEKAELLEQAKQKAETALSRYAQGETFDAIGEDMEGTYAHIGYAANGASDMLTWAFDDARQEGDTTVAANGEKGYYAVLFHSRSRDDYHPVTIRHILVEDEATAEEILADFKAGDATESDFAALASTKSTDSGTASNGGLVSNMRKGAYVQPFEDW